MQGPSRTRSLLLTGGVSLADPCARGGLRRGCTQVPAGYLGARPAGLS
jgi:hypothetical protein